MITAMDSRTENGKRERRTETDYDLRNLVLEASELNRGVAHTGSTFRRYGDGFWRDVPDLEIKQVVAGMLEARRYDARLSLSVNTENNVTNSIKSHTYTRTGCVGQASRDIGFPQLRARHVDHATAKYLQLEIGPRWLPASSGR